MKLGFNKDTWLLLCLCVYEEQQQVPYPFLECYHFLKTKVRFIEAFQIPCITQETSVASASDASTEHPIGVKAAKKQRKNEAFLDDLAKKFGLKENDIDEEKHTKELQKTLTDMKGLVQNGLDMWKLQMQLQSPYLSEEEKKVIHDKYFKN